MSRASKFVILSFVSVFSSILFLVSKYGHPDKSLFRNNALQPEHLHKTHLYAKNIFTEQYEEFIIDKITLYIDCLSNQKSMIISPDLYKNIFDLISGDVCKDSKYACWDQDSVAARIFITMFPERDLGQTSFARIDYQVIEFSDNNFSYCLKIKDKNLKEKTLFFVHEGVLDKLKGMVSS